MDDGGEYNGEQEENKEQKESRKQEEKGGDCRCLFCGDRILISL
ncbi:hypothetical protein [Hominifimenecus microfluidus]|nr:hypothetical protein [Hominifimenecus microfluidus]